MIKKTVLSIFLLMIFGFSFSQVNPSKIKKSLVKVIVQGKHSGVASGFLWKETNQVVTSLHAMQESAKIMIVYTDASGKSSIKKATIEKVYKPADLVMLKVEGTIPSGFVAFNSYNDNKIEYAADIHAFGYNSGAEGSSSRKLSKGYASPEILSKIIPPKDVIAIKNAGMPDLDLDIFYLQGSLLPGFSGAPAVNKNGELIGICDGGLENGASNVSWIIPAKYLVDLENSTTKELPTGIVAASQSFSAKVEIDIDYSALIEKEEISEDDLSNFITEDYKEVSYNGYNFVKTKTRSLEELYETTDVLDKNISYFIEYLNEFQYDLSDFNYDIYEDLEYGVVITVPAGMELFTDDDNSLTINTGTYEYSLFFEVMNASEFSTNLDDIIDIMIESTDEIYNESEQDVYTKINDITSYIIEYENDMSIAHISIDVLETDTDKPIATQYFTIAINPETVLIASANIEPETDVMYNMENYYGENCEGDFEEGTFCLEFYRIINYMISIQLTTFANTNEK